MTATTVSCGNCKITLSEHPSTPVELRTPCPSCGSTTRLFDVRLEGSVNIHSELRYKAKRGGKGKAFIEGIVGDSLYRKIEQWMRLERVIDRENDAYREVVTDPKTNKEVHRCEEPLSQHLGHGGDRKNKLTE
jgi:hypothetical protein